MLDIPHDLIVFFGEELADRVEHILHHALTLFQASIFLQAAAFCQKLQKGRIVLDLFQPQPDVGTINMYVLLLGKTRVFLNKIALAVFQNVLRQALHGLFLDHPLDDLFDKRSQAFQRLGEELGVPVNGPKPVDIGIIFPLIRVF